MHLKKGSVRKQEPTTISASKKLIAINFDADSSKLQKLYDWNTFIPTFPSTPYNEKRNAGLVLESGLSLQSLLFSIHEALDRQFHQTSVAFLDVPNY